MKAYILKLIAFLVIAIAMSYSLSVRQNIDFLIIAFTVLVWLGVVVEILSIIKEYKRIKKGE